MNNQQIEIIDALCDSLDDLTNVLCYLEPLTDSINNLVDVQQASRVKPTSRESELMIAVLKAEWLKVHIFHSESEYIAAINRFEILAGL